MPIATDFRDTLLLDLQLTLRELEDLHRALEYAEETVSDHDCSGSTDCEGCNIQLISLRVSELIEASVVEASENNTWQTV
tara:strand:- start:65 stop:304 length:240 start_codon:yes stop_codon:yes gene_type:complete